MNHCISPVHLRSRKTIAIILLAIATLTPRANAQLSHGPIVGHVSGQQANIWARAKTPGTYTLRISGANTESTSQAKATAENDHCLKWTVAKLKPATRYRYMILRGSQALARGEQYAFTTPTTDQTGSARLAFGSCADEKAGSAAVWRRMNLLAPDAVVLLGDTPYIDSVDLAVVRKRHAAFLAVPELQQLVAGRSLYAIWDDHDFGRNDTDGNLPGKEKSRRGFIEYHANPTYGDGKEGIYTKFRRGDVEVFLLDTRFFAATENSPAAPDKPSLLGKEQWNWLLAGLKESSARFKILACGMVWNKAVRPGKKDQWGTYEHEREALFKFIGDQSISGVILVSGDVHRTRVMSHLTDATAGYRIPELTTSPIHEGIIANSNQPHPGLVFDSGTANSFLLLTSSGSRQQAALTAQFLTKDGKTFFKRSYSLRELTKN